MFFIAITRGAASNGEEDFVSIWRECSDDQKDCLGSIVVPIGNLSFGLCRHRALLFKVGLCSYAVNEIVFDLKSSLLLIAWCCCVGYYYL